MWSHTSAHLTFTTQPQDIMTFYNNWLMPRKYLLLQTMLNTMHQVAPDPSFYLQVSQAGQSLTCSLA